MGSVHLQPEAPKVLRSEGAAVAFLVCRVGARLVALPLEHVVETMRVLPREKIAGAPEFVSGVSIVRGEAVPVIDARRLLGAEDQEAARMVTLRVGGRLAALAVDAVLDVRRLSSEALGALPPLLKDAGEGAVGTMATLDSELLMLLQTARLVPESVWSSLARGRADG